MFISQETSLGDLSAQQFILDVLRDPAPVFENVPNFSRTQVEAAKPGTDYRVEFRSNGSTIVNPDGTFDGETNRIVIRHVPTGAFVVVGLFASIPVQDLVDAARAGTGPASQANYPLFYDVLLAGAPGVDGALLIPDNGVLEGSADDDTLTGGIGNDRFIGTSGTDTINGGDGDDTLDYCGTSVALTVDVDAGTVTGTGTSATLTSIEIVRGSAKNDTMIGRAILGGALFGCDGDDRIVGRGGDDVLDGENGNDEILGKAGNDQIEGGAGNDILDGGDDRDTVSGGSGDDRLLGGADKDVLHGGADQDTILGGAGDDTLKGGSGDDFLVGGTDNDLLNGGSGADHLIGFDGNDRLFGGTGNDRLSGGVGDDTLHDGAGDDIVSGGDGKDKLVSTSGDDDLRGGDGDDEFILKEGRKFARGDGGKDVFKIREHTSGTAFGNEGSDTFEFQGIGDLLARGGAGNDLFKIGSEIGYGYVLEGGAGEDFYDLDPRSGARILDFVIDVDSLILLRLTKNETHVGEIEGGAKLTTDTGGFYEFVGVSVTDLQDLIDRSFF